MCVWLLLLLVPPRLSSSQLKKLRHKGLLLLLATFFVIVVLLRLISKKASERESKPEIERGEGEDIEKQLFNAQALYHQQQVPQGLCFRSKEVWQDMHPRPTRLWWPRQLLPSQGMSHCPFAFRSLSIIVLSMPRLTCQKFK